MNQILYFQEKRNSNPVDTKKIVLFFAVSIIIFGLILLGQGAYSIYSSYENQKVTPSEPVEEEYVPTIELTKTEDNKLIINVGSEIALSNIIYNWNSDSAETIDVSGKTNVEEIVEIPAGENTINISIIDSNGKETKKQETFVIESSKPVIELAVAGNDIKIKVTSEVEISYVTYKWNSDEEKKEDMKTFENRKSFEKTLQIPKGKNTLKIVAVDVNENKSEKSQDIKGVAKLKDPKVTKKGEFIYFVFNAEENMKTVEFTFNGKKYVMNSETFGQTKTVKYKVKLIEGWNYLKLIGTTESDVQNTTVWKYEYKK